MTVPFRQLTSQVFAAPQIGLAEVAEAARAGFGMIVNNRPEDESDDRPQEPRLRQPLRRPGSAMWRSR